MLSGEEVNDNFYILVNPCRGSNPQPVSLLFKTRQDKTRTPPRVIETADVKKGKGEIYKL